ncbi:unnamed protein product [Acanthosepion pharaonis]|uniref:Uncharacterized protein n=1 Tax=Acanthosepion pharaonis TaxID=158019 RepID=A0A812E496_ACAPH|nr:unnamed protein product [Sepia pharaonis]
MAPTSHLLVRFFANSKLLPPPLPLSPIIFFSVLKTLLFRRTHLFSCCRSSSSSSFSPSSLLSSLTPSAPLSNHSLLLGFATLIVVPFSFSSLFFLPPTLIISPSLCILSFPSLPPLLNFLFIISQIDIHHTTSLLLSLSLLLTSLLLSLSLLLTSLLLSLSLLLTSLLLSLSLLLTSLLLSLSLLLTSLLLSLSLLFNVSLALSLSLLLTSLLLSLSLSF